MTQRAGSGESPPAVFSGEGFQPPCDHAACSGWWFEPMFADTWPCHCPCHMRIPFWKFVLINLPGRLALKSKMRSKG